jgi:NNP family nitrate/nitrite transporter-like MFS transporter
MPIIYDSLRLDRHMSPHKAWRVAFIVPFILIVVTAVGMLLTCQDTPIGRGRWAEREQDTQDLLDAHLGPRQQMAPMSDGSSSPAHEVELDRKSSDQKVELEAARSSIDIAHGSVNEIELSADQMLDVARGEVVRKPTTKEAMRVIFSPQAAFHCATYMCSFGGELAINSYIASYYLKNFPYLGQTHAGRWGSMFGLLNIITRPLGGVIADLLYVHVSKNLWIKKGWINFVGVVSGIFLVAIGKVNPHNESMMFGLIAGMAFFLEAGNGANFALVPVSVATLDLKICC